MACIFLGIEGVGPFPNAELEELASPLFEEELETRPFNRATSDFARSLSFSSFSWPRWRSRRKRLRFP